MEKQTFQNKLLKMIRETRGLVEQAETEAAKALSEVQDEKQKIILQHAMQKAKEGRLEEVKNILAQLNASI